MVELDDNIRSAVQTLVADAPEPPSWEFVQATKARLRRRRNLTIGALVVVLLLAGVAVVGRVSDDDQTVVAGPIGSDVEGLPCEGWVAVHTLFDSSANAQVDPTTLLATVTAEQAAFLVKSGDVPDRVAERLGGYPGDLAARVVARANTNLGTIEITAWADSAAGAQQLADAFAESLLASVSDIQQREIDRQRDVLNAAIRQLETDLAGVAGTDRTADATRERLTTEISQKQVQLQELDQQARRARTSTASDRRRRFRSRAMQLATVFSEQPHR